MRRGWVCGESFVPGMRRGRVCGESFVPDMRRGRVCRESFVPEVGPCGSCWASFVPDMRRGRVSRESFVPKGPGVVVVGRIMSCSGVVLVPVAGRSALAPLMGSAAESSVSWRSPRRRWGFCTTRSPLTECRRRVEPSCSAIPPDWWRRGRPKTADVQQRPARARAGRHDIQQSGVLQCPLRGEHEDHHDRVVERVEQPRVGHVLPGLHVHERQNDAERQVGEEVLPLMAVHVGEQCR